MTARTQEAAQQQSYSRPRHDSWWPTRPRIFVPERRITDKLKKCKELNVLLVCYDGAMNGNNRTGTSHFCCVRGAKLRDRPSP